VKKDVHDCLDLLADLANILLVVFLVSMHQSCTATLVITFDFSVVEWLNTAQPGVQWGQAQVGHVHIEYPVYIRTCKYSWHQPLFCFKSLFGV
jgi:hypothetical protein